MPIGWAITVVVLSVAVLALAVIVLGLLRQVAPVLERVTAGASNHDHRILGPAIGSALPDFSVRGADGVVTSEQLRGHPVVLLFLTVGCGPCGDLAQEISRAYLGDLAGKLVVVTSPDGPQELGIPADLRILTELDQEVSGPLSVFGTPFAVAVDPDGIVRSAAVANTISELNDLAASLT